MALYMGGYLAVHMGVLGAGVALLSRQRLQERQGRWLKLMSGAVMLGLSLYLVLAQTQA
jgi:arginine exporter protein ArgO